MKEDVKTALIKKAEEVSRNAEFILDKTRDWLVIKQFMSNRLQEISLTPEQEKKKQRYEYMIGEILTGKSTDLQIVNLTKNIFKISISQAYEDLNSTKEILPMVINIKKNYEQNLALQLNTRYKAKAEEMGDLKALAQFEKNRIALIKELPDDIESLADNFEGHTYEMVFDPSLLGGSEKVNMKEILAAINAKRGKAIKIDMFEELEYKEVENDND